MSGALTGRSFIISSELQAAGARLRMVKAREIVGDGEIIHVDFAHIEARELARLRLFEAVDEIARRAGVKNARGHVYFAHLKTQPPRMQWVGDDGAPVPGTSRRNRRTRRVIVGSEWLRLRAPKLWCAFVAARLLGIPTLPLAPSWGDNHKRI